VADMSSTEGVGEGGGDGGNGGSKERSCASSGIGVCVLQN